jgi:SAM-dependent MidA family methyltransferase
LARGDLRALIVERIHLGGPITFAEFMDLALYHPELGYYARATHQSGRAGDFFTSVDVGPSFGRLLARQCAEMWRLVDRPSAFDLVEAGASSGRLAKDVLDAAQHFDGDFYDAIRLRLVEKSPRARAAQQATLNGHTPKLASSGEDVPASVTGVIYANELLDAFPVHAVEMTGDGLSEVVVDADGDHLIERLRPAPQNLADYLAACGAHLRPGWKAEINLNAVQWTGEAARAIDRGFLLLIDYGHESSDLYAASHAGGTRAAFSQHVHREDAPGAASAPWLDDPGASDITSHVDLTSVARAAIDAGMIELGRLDQTYFLLNLAMPDLDATREAETPAAGLRHRLALKTLMLPGGLGSTHKVLIFGKDVERPDLIGTSRPYRLT